ncbi:MADS-box transcription factor [Mycena venus]|uniref:MADS-box transcription factor n=1 Tax=Mycena venus TaxID=2733690 RepID=A0A8H6YWH4_9AGAR|nr:MADS-box transcription factor [Mycena venus]
MPFRRFFAFVQVNGNGSSSQEPRQEPLVDVDPASSSSVVYALVSIFVILFLLCIITVYLLISFFLVVVVFFVYVQYALDPVKRICQYEVPGGGVCRDAGCEDVHLNRVGREGGAGVVEPSDADTAEYLHNVLPSAWVTKHSANIPRIAAALQEARIKNATLVFEERDVCISPPTLSSAILDDFALLVPPQSVLFRSFCPPWLSARPTPYSYSDAALPSLSGLSYDQSSQADSSSTTGPMRKRQRTLDMHSGAPGPNDAIDAANVGDNAFIADHDAIDSAGDDDDDDDKPKAGQKQGRRKIKIEFIQDKSRRHITFSKRKAGEYYEKGNFSSSFIHLCLTPVQAYELSTLTGTQVLLLVVSETGLVYTFTTAKLQPLVTQPEGKNLIQACLNAPHGTLPSSMPVGAPLGRSSGPMGGPGGPPVSNNMPGGLSISGGPTNSSSKDDDDPNDDDESAHGGRASTGDKRRRRSSTTNASSTGSGAPSSNTRGATSPHQSNSVPPPPLSIPSGAARSAFTLWSAVPDRYRFADVPATAPPAACDVSRAVLGWGLVPAPIAAAAPSAAT